MQKEMEMVINAFEDKFDVKLSVFEAEQLLTAANDDSKLVVLAIRKAHTSNPTPEKPFQYVKSVVIGENQRAKSKKVSDAKSSDAIVGTIKQCYQMFIDDKTITDDEYNTILYARTGKNYNVEQYQQVMFRIQKQMYKHPRQWVHGLGLTRWEEQAFAELVPEQQEHFNIDLIRKAGIQYEKDFVPDPEITPLAIKKKFGIPRIELYETSH